MRGMSTVVLEPDAVTTLGPDAAPGGPPPAPAPAPAAEERPDVDGMLLTAGLRAVDPPALGPPAMRVRDGGGRIGGYRWVGWACVGARGITSVSEVDGRGVRA